MIGPGRKGNLLAPDVLCLLDAVLKEACTNGKDLWSMSGGDIRAVKKVIDQVAMSFFHKDYTVTPRSLY